MGRNHRFWLFRYIMAGNMRTKPGGNKIVALLPFNKLLTLLPLLGILLLADMAVGQQSSTPLLTLQRSRAYLNLETNVVHGQGMNGITYGKGGMFDLNSLSCVLVYGDGKFVLEKREETTVGKPKDHLARNLPRGRIKFQALLFHARADGLEDGEAAVAFIQMQHARRDAHGFKRAIAAHAQQQLLPDAGARIAAIEPRRGVKTLRRIAGHIRVQQQKIAAAHTHPPHLGANRTAARGNLHHHRLAVHADRRLHGQLIRIVSQILLALPAGFVEPLQK